MTAERYRLLKEYVGQCMGEGARDGGHLGRVLHAALLLARDEGNVDMEVLLTAALLQDIGRAEQQRGGENHAVAGARMAEEFLKEQGDEAAFVRRVAECIRLHHMRAEDVSASMEAKIMCDADRLDMAGALGVARTLMYQGHAGHPLYSVGPDGTVLSGEERTPSFYSEFRRRLHGISGRFMTDAGRRRAQQRSEAAERFFRDLRAEVAAGESGSAWRLLPQDATDHQRRVFNLSLMLAGESEKITRAALAEAVMRDLPDSPGNAAERVVIDANTLDGLGALGAARRLLALGQAHASLEDMFAASCEEPVFHTTQARGIAAGREPAGKAFIAALRNELEETRAAGEQALSQIVS